MRFLIIAFVTTALVPIASPAMAAEEGISPAIFAQCEAKSPNDFKQQLACVKEQVDAFNALNALKKPDTRQIVVAPKVDAVDDTTDDTPPPADDDKAVAASPPDTEDSGNDAAADTGNDAGNETADDAGTDTGNDTGNDDDGDVAATAPAAPAGAVASPKLGNLNLEAVEDFCGEKHDRNNAVAAWNGCIEGEKAAYISIDDALETLNSDIPGDAYLACRNFVAAYQPDADGFYISHQSVLACLKAKAPTREFAKCYETFVHRSYNRDVRSVPAANAKEVSNCFNATIAGGP